MPFEWLKKRGLRTRDCTLALLAALLATMLWALLATSAGAQDRWSDPFPGVRYLQRTASGPNQIDVLQIDLCHGGISLRATTEAESMQTVPAWASSVGVELAVNADFFDRARGFPRGAARGNGETWGSADGASRGFAAFGTDRVYLSPHAEVVHPLPDWPRHVIGGMPTILQEGEVIAQTSALCTDLHPRTALGFSRDRQTMYLMVVDGRSSASIGMTCEQEAALLRDLGAWEAINLDGGGSSTMWIRGMGLRNAPSDGSPRIVANHLGVHAGGSNEPSSCMPYGPHEDALAAGVFATTSSDIDGDGRADACARGLEGFECALSNGTSFAVPLAGPRLSDAYSWNDPSNYRTIAMGDVTGDGRADVCARGNAGWRCWPSTGEGFEGDFQLDAMSDENGWDAPERYGTIRLGDIDGDGDDDVCGRAADGLRCWPSLGDGFGEPTEPIAALSDDAGFDVPARWSTIRLGDVDGDGRADVCARSAEALSCWRSTAAGFDPTPIAGPAWSDDAGWSGHPYYSTIRLVDVDGDGRADVCGRADTGLQCHLSTGEGFGPAIVLEALADDRGWADPSNYRTIELADIDADGDRDVCARGNAGIFCWRFEGDRFGERIDGPKLGDEGGWWRAKYLRSFRFADIDGDHDADLCARPFNGLRCWPVEDGVFGAPIQGPEWSRDLGWWDPSYHGTIRIAGVRSPAPPVPRDGGVVVLDAGGPDAGGVDGSTEPRAPSVGGCGCRAVGRTEPGFGVGLVAVALAFSLVRRRSR